MFHISPVINSAWKYGLSVKSNFNRLGLAYDANEALGNNCDQVVLSELSN